MNERRPPPLEIPELPIVVGRSELDAVKPVSDSVVTMTHLMAPQDTNLWGNVFGGVILAAVDRIAYVSSARHSGCAGVTASFDQVDFRSPIQIGEMVTLEASVNTVGRTSMEIGVRVSADSVTGGHERQTNQCYVTFVAIDDEMHPVPVPRLRIETEEEYLRYHEAELRKFAREELERLKAAYREPEEI